MATSGTGGGGRIDPARSACVLIGVDTYTELRSLPSVHNNLVRLREVLTDETIWGVPPDRIREVSNPQTAPDLVGAVREMAELAEDTLIVYYSGHGLLDSGGEQLLLTLPGSRQGRPETAVPFGLVREAIQAESSADRCVMILDCCYGGRVLEGMAAASVGEHVVQAAAVGERVRGSYFMTSAASNRRALTPDTRKSERCTVFTGELIDILRNGVPDGAEMLDLNALFRRVRAQLISDGKPEPQEQDRNQVGALPFVRNRALLPPAELDGPVPVRPGATRGRVLAVAAVVLAFFAGLLVPTGVSWWHRIHPTRPGGPCSSRATLLSVSDALNKRTVKGEAITDLSALAMNGPSQVLALTDRIPGGRVFPISLGSPEHLTPRAGEARTLRGREGTPYGSYFDGEGLVLEKGSRTMLIASETGPTIRRFSLGNGKEVGDPLPIPKRFRLEPDGEGLAGRTLESLGATPDGRYVFAGMEAPLSADGDTQGRNLLRIQRYKGTPGGTYTLDRQYAYQTAEGLNLVELIALSDDRLLTLERQFVRGLGNAIRVYDVSLANKQDVTGFKTLYDHPADTFVDSRLLFDLSQCPAGSPGQVAAKEEQTNPLLANVEGMALAPPETTGAHRGWRTLYMVSDDNRAEEQITRLYAFRIRV